MSNTLNENCCQPLNERFIGMFLLWPCRNCKVSCSPNVMLYSALKPRFLTKWSVVNLIVSKEVLTRPRTVTVNPGLKPLSLSILWPKMSVNSTKSQLQGDIGKFITYKYRLTFATQGVWWLLACEASEAVLLNNHELKRGKTRTS